MSNHPSAVPTADLRGLVAVVTGGASGIGLATAQVMLERGADVAVLDLHPSGLPSGLFGIRADVTDDVSVIAAIESVVSRWGRIDILANNAGIGAAGSVADNPDDEWHRVFDVNVVGIARVTRAALPHLRRSPAAAVVNTGSVVATVGLPQRAVYTASKGAVEALTRAMAADHLREAIRVNAVSPGTTDTPWVQRLLDAADDADHHRRALEARQPLRRLVTAEEVAEAIVYLASPRTGSTTGTVLTVDGGLQALRLPPAAIRESEGDRRSPPP